MTGDEIVALVRENYGDADNNYLDDSAIESWVNEAVQQVYTMLPDGDMREVVQESSVALTSGRGDIPSTWDRVISVYTTSDGELLRLPSHVANAQANLSSYFVPDALGFALDGNEIVVTGQSVSSSVTVQYLVQPDEITNFSAEVTGIPHRYHPTVADIATSLAYASEEDSVQSRLYTERAERALAGRVQEVTP